ncbi:MAG: hypothetical protein A2758_02730 [Candidatus Zambryskibacteria bacterium RIFCSPHIGHO2_01_FULL_49_18]|uniref:DUF559 domain-containing protein n=2 Tax=Candidatus Zambryskiibacteriota TaxID=1817925 RepID=A0A1G2T3F3_9BACT|nr:MAG: hypothetical protein A2758_02730 [Candidatus Zambryskibacteria bacterium RIFCSPHIGHO2_01_FULL_49_18]OHB04990.1 MAG: hypothetical protein A3A26_00225 [Candidatus Zambryskibacteria bacterium RIFCSPLOWO2_01_FULL_47_14]
MKYDFIPYDKNLVSRARELRNNQTREEKFFWSNILKSEEFRHLTFLRQKPIGNFIMDFYCAKLLLGIEIDGDIHDANRDKERDYILKKKFGITVIRYRNEDIINKTENVKQNLLKSIPPLIKGG